jgi:predicted ribosomally synthesized peptide with nif11-like leader
MLPDCTRPAGARLEAGTTDSDGQILWRLELGALWIGRSSLPCLPGAAGVESAEGHRTSGTPSKEEDTMPKETALAFVERLKNDSAFARRIADAPDDATRRKIVADAGFNLEAEDRAHIEGELGDLPDHELEGVAEASSGSLVAMAAGAALPAGP